MGENTHKTTFAGQMFTAKDQHGPFVSSTFGHEMTLQHIVIHSSLLPGPLGCLVVLTTFLPVEGILLILRYAAQGILATVTPEPLPGRERKAGQRTGSACRERERGWMDETGAIQCSRTVLANNPDLIQMVGSERPLGSFSP